MAKDSILQVRIDGELKHQAEALYRSMGMSLSEAVRMFVTQSVQENQMPFRPHTAPRRGACRAFGALRLYKDPSLRVKERDAWIASLSAKATAARGEQR